MMESDVDYTRPCRKCQIPLDIKDWSSSRKKRGYICTPCRKKDGRRRVRKRSLAPITGDQKCRRCSVILNEKNWYPSSRRIGAMSCVKCEKEKSKERHRRKIAARKGQKSVGRLVDSPVPTSKKSKPTLFLWCRDCGTFLSSDYQVEGEDLCKKCDGS